MFQAPRGTQDILPEASPRWQHVGETARRQAELHGFAEIRTPTFEDLALFIRSVGDSTDIVEKEIYAFEDKGGDRLALRPEATASVVRAYLQHGMFNRPQPVRLFSFVNAFRYDRPQAGRFREFHQFNCEAIGDGDPLVDAELVTLLWRIYAELGLRNLSLNVNSIGDSTCRPAFIRSLTSYYETNQAAICADCARRLTHNPLRLLDCKQVRCQPIIDSAPRTVDHLCSACDEHFSALRSYLSDREIPFTLNHRLVRGLDYYTRTVFEVWPPETGAQSTIGGGGRYDGLAEQLGGRPTPGIGFATGIERILLNLERQSIQPGPAAESLAYLVPIGPSAKRRLNQLADRLRADGIAAIVGTGDRSVKSLLRQANSVGARWALVMGDDEVNSGTVNVRDLTSGANRAVPLEGVSSCLKDAAP